MSDIAKSFKNVFISQKNSGYLFELIITKILQNDPQFKKYIITYIDTYKSNIIDLQSFIFEDNFTNIYNEMQTSGAIDLEQLLIVLNKITVVRFEKMIIDDLTKKYTEEQEEQYKLQQEEEQYKLQQEEQYKLQQEEQYKLQQEEQYKLQQEEERYQKQREEGQYLRQQQKEHIQQREQQYQEQQYQEQQLETINTKDEELYEVKYHHLFSKNAIFQNGRYEYNIDINRIISLNLDNIKVLCNMYNINEYNNKMYLIEQNNKILITIPVGYYSIDHLLVVMTTIFNNASINKNKDYKFYATLNTLKNKIYFGCELNEREKFKRNIVFGMSFVYEKYPKTSGRITSLNEILGFEKLEYVNNTTYVCENSPNINIFSDIYVKLFVNDTELIKYTTSNSIFSYYDCLDLNMDREFGKIVRFNKEYKPYDIYNKDYKITTLALEFYNSNMDIINTPIRFDTTFLFECRF